MLIIVGSKKAPNPNFPAKRTEEVVHWHYGEPIPKVCSESVLTFQADGDELTLFIQAMRESRRNRTDPLRDEEGF